MPTDIKPLFRPEALRVKVQHLIRLPAVLQAGKNLIPKWAKLAATGKFNETELLPEFLNEIFVDLLGYVGRDAGHKLYTFRRESLIQVDGKRADAALGQFERGTGQFVVVLEGKGPLDPLDRPFAGRRDI